MENLFEIPVCESPRLKWLKKHSVKTKHFPDCEAGDEDEFGNELWPWIAWLDCGSEGIGTFHAGALKEDEAIANLAVRMKWKLWNEEQLTPVV